MTTCQACDAGKEPSDNNTACGKTLLLETMHSQTEDLKIKCQIKCQIRNIGQQNVL